MEPIKFTTRLEKLSTWTIAVVPIDIKKVFNTKKHLRVKGTIDGIAFGGTSLMPMGDGTHCLTVRAKLRRDIKKEAGAKVEIVFEKDEAELEIPIELMEAFEASAEAKKMFDSFSFSNRKYFIQHINDAKHQSTKDRRAVAGVLRLEKLYQQKHGI